MELGAAFTPQYHNAIGRQPADVPHDTVAEVVRTGYTFDGQVLRPARVVVGDSCPCAKMTGLHATCRGMHIEQDGRGMSRFRRQAVEGTAMLPP